jgi:hypothetical protein
MFLTDSGRQQTPFSENGGGFRRLYQETKPAASPNQTRFIGGGDYSALSSEGTATAVADIEVATAVAIDADLTSKDEEARAYFLAKRFAGESSLADDARLARVTERLRRLHPRITAADIARLDEDVTELEENAEFLAALNLELEGN